MTDAPPQDGPASDASAATGDYYTAYSYLTAGEDFRGFELAPEFGRVPPYAGRPDRGRAGAGPASCSGTTW